MAIHIGLYWQNLRGLDSSRWWSFYYVAQPLLIIVIAMLPAGGEEKTFGLNFLGSAIISIIGEALGLWGNTRRAFLLGIFYLAILVSVFYIKVNTELFCEYLSQLLINGGFIVLIMVIFNKQLEERQKAEELAEKLESTNAKLAAYAARNESLTLQAERERMARELHDTLAQGVAGLILQLEALKAHQQSKNYENAEKIIAQALDRARNTLSESRAAIEDLRNENTDFKKTVERLIAQFEATGETKYELKIQLEDEKKLPQNIQHHARRVLHEALTNIQKHAQAEVASVSIVQSEKMLDVRIKDNGVGFSPDEIQEYGHFGLQGFQERAQLTNSQYKLISSPNEGTIIEFLFSLDEGESA
ncbi:MAG: sensor histidine kinase [Anaerolineae bacterium]|nr:sensor histidine kinase [Anaerolineae bacterium]MBT7191674.1 sensor histidine kinase [Anaerolineae bacterium]MBT7991770.1 sensor histidine kinase [Anaerolineae bacterium]